MLFQALALALPALLVPLFNAPSAMGQPFLRGLYDANYYSSNAQTRARWFDAARDAGADIAQVRIGWRGATGPRAPANPRDPADPGYDFSNFDDAIRDAAARGLTVLATVSQAPNWAEGAGRPASADPGTWKPDPAAFGAFAQALARRYSGAFVPGPGQAPLPRVDYFEAWNEPNIEQFLAPQWQGGKPYAPAHFRELLNAFYAGIRGAGSTARILGPGTAPYGDPPGGTRMRPLVFVRELLCLRRDLKAKACPRRAQLDIVSHHPMNLLGGPVSKPGNRDDLVVANMDSLRRTVRAAERQGTLSPSGHRPLWVSELWWITNPPHDAGFSPRLQAHFLAGALHALWSVGVQAVVWYQIMDESGLPTGLYSSNGTPKPSLSAFRFPFVTKAGKRNGHAWTIPPADGKLTIQRRTPNGWRSVRSVQAIAGKPLKVPMTIPPRAAYRAQVAGATSLPSVP